MTRSELTKIVSEWIFKYHFTVNEGDDARYLSDSHYRWSESDSNDSRFSATVDGIVERVLGEADRLDDYSLSGEMLYKKQTGPSVDLKLRAMEFALSRDASFPSFEVAYRKILALLEE